MNPIISNLLSGLIGSIIGGYISGQIALDAVRRSEYFRHVAALKRVLREVDAGLNSSSGYPAVTLESRLAEMKPLADDVIAFASRCNKRRIRIAWETLTLDKQALQEAKITTTPIEYTKVGTVESKKLIRSRIQALVSHF